MYWERHFVSFAFPSSQRRGIPCLKQSLSRPERTYGADVLQRERKRKAALNAGANIELAQLQTQAVTIRIIANLSGRPLENRMQDIVGQGKGGAESGFQPVAIADQAAELIAGNLNRTAPSKKVGDASGEEATIRISNDARASKQVVARIVVHLDVR